MLGDTAFAADVAGISTAEVCMGGCERDTHKTVDVMDVMD